MNTEQWKVINELRAEGYAVTIFNPEELDGVNESAVEDRLVELGWQVIEDLK